MWRHVLLMLLTIGCDDGTKPTDGTDTDDTEADFSDGDGDGYDEAYDCNDQDSSVYPGAVEICDGIDNDCDDEIDEDVMDTFYQDADDDGFGDEDTTVEACDNTSGYVTNGSDCDDDDENAYPGATEVCDEVDNDCDGEIDEEVGGVWYADEDQDGTGDPENEEYACEQPDGYVEDSSDCDDTDDEVNPSGTEVCDGVDNDCDGTADGDDAVDILTWYPDADEDEFAAESGATQSCDAPSGYIEETEWDCDDSDDTVYPGSVDEAAYNECMLDADGDGYGDAGPPSGYDAGSDCDDSDGTIHPGAVNEAVSIECMLDADGDGYGDNYPPSGFDAGTDCNDSDALTFPGAVDEAESDECMLDADGDGFGDNTPPIGYDGGTDCDDDDATVVPIDEDGDGSSTCEGDCDDDDSSLNLNDADGDGYSTCDGDCDDDDSSLNLDDLDGDSISTCDGDCDDEDITMNLDDLDGDGYSTCDGDCDDGDATLNVDDLDGDGYSTCDDDCDDDDSSLNLDDVDGDGYSTCEDDCDDEDEDLHLDDADGDGLTSCDGDCDDDDSSMNLDDADGDGVTSCDGDCDDDDSAVLDCSCELTAVGSPSMVTWSGSTYGVWMSDPEETLGAGIIWEMDSYTNSALLEFASESDMISRTVSSTTSLPETSEGTGAVVYDGYLYYNKTNSNTLVQYDIDAGAVVDTLVLTGAGYHNSYHYGWGGYSDIDLAVDEQGLWVLYGTAANSGRMVISKLDTDPFAIEDTWETNSSSKTSLGNAFMICGVMYTTSSYYSSSATINYAYDTNDETDWVPGISFRNQYGYNSSIDYNPADGMLYSWDSSYRVNYTTTVE